MSEAKDVKMEVDDSTAKKRFEVRQLYYIKFYPFLG
jgi:hypothetical protein